MQHFKQYINGKFESGKNSFETVNPATEKVWAKVAQAGVDDVNRAVESSKQAFESWKKLLPNQRAGYLLKLAELIEKNVDELAEIETKDTGKIIRETKAQIGYMAQYYRYYAGLADKVQGAFLPVDKPDMQVTLIREPLGVVAGVIPWNSQLFLSAMKLAPGLAMGCTFVIKASEIAPAFLLKFAELIEKAHFPAGVVNIITGFAEDCSKPLTEHPDISKIAFTGGVETARHIVANSSNNLAKVSLELGGKSPFIVFEDANMESAVNAQIAGIFGASGQSCVAGSRLIIHENIKDEFLQKLKSRAEKIIIGDPEKTETEFGPLCSKRQLDFITDMVQKSIDKGAQLITGGKPIEGEGYYYPPTILDCSNHQDADTVVNELFGPVLSVLTFKTEAEAVQIANNTEFGLASGIFTNNLTLAHRMTREVHAGVVWVNTYRAISPLAPFGGYGLSGHGREGGIDGALDYTTTKTIWLKTSDEPIGDPFIMR